MLAYPFSFSGSQRDTICYVLLMCLGIFSWPFASLLGIWHLIELAFTKRLWPSVYYMAQGTIISSVPIAVLVFFDSRMYDKLVIAPWNIVSYNLFTDRGPDLYGTEPWWFYLVNLSLNFNIAFLLALLAVPLLILRRESTSAIFRSAEMSFWIIALSCLAHKEERFMFVIYPGICLNAGIFLIKIRPFVYKWLYMPMYRAILVLFCCLSIGRIASNYYFYHAPLEIYPKLSMLAPGKLCLGSEWHRFPSHFLVPHNMTVGFLPTGFDGSLPVYFETIAEEQQVLDKLQSIDALVKLGRQRTRLLHVPNPVLNDKNKQHADQWTTRESCNYFVGTVNADAELPSWTRYSCTRFLDREATPRVTRLTGFGAKKWLDYCIFTSDA